MNLLFASLYTWSVAAAGDMGLLERSQYPTCPENPTAKRAKCQVHVLTEASGVTVTSVEGCDEPYAKVSRLAAESWGMRTLPQTLLKYWQSTYVVIVSDLGEPAGLYAGFEVRFKTKGGGCAVDVGSSDVLRMRGRANASTTIRDMPHYRDKAVECRTMLAVSKEGTTADVVAVDCPADLFEGITDDLLAWRWHPLIIAGEPRPFAMPVQLMFSHSTSLDEAMYGDE